LLNERLFKRSVLKAAFNMPKIYNVVSAVVDQKAKWEQAKKLSKKSTKGKMVRGGQE